MQFNCKNTIKACFDKGDPLFFTSERVEQIQVILNYLEHQFEIPVHLHFTEDIDLFNRYFTKKGKAYMNDWAGCDTNTGLIWVNPKKHMTSPFAQLLNTLVHEALHCKYPKATESRILHLANSYVGVTG